MTTIHHPKPAAACPPPQHKGVFVSDKNVRIICQHLANSIMRDLALMHFYSPTFEQEFLMGQLFTDWEAIKGIIRAKDDAIAAQQKQIDTLTATLQGDANLQTQLDAQQQQINTLQAEVPDAADLAASTEMHEVVLSNTPPAQAPAPAPVAAPPVAGQ